MRADMAKNVSMYAPIEAGIRSSMNTAAPEKTSTKITIRIAKTMLMLDSSWMPRSTPLTAEITKHSPSTTMMPMTTATLSDVMVPVSRNPPWICSAPRPSEAAVPNTVAKIARTSSTLPCQPFARRAPISGVNALEMRCRPP